MSIMPAGRSTAAAGASGAPAVLVPASLVSAAVLVLALLPAVAAGETAAAALEGCWPQWRGPLATGAAPRGDPPVVWGERGGARKNIRWRTALPGKGHSSPVVWGELVLLTTAIPFGEALPPLPETAPGAHDNLRVTHRHRFVVLAVDREDGTVAWQRTVREDLPHEGGHNTGSYASASPVTDGEHVWAFFGSRGLFCLDLDGTVVWKRDLGIMHTKHGHGEGASPALHGDTLIVNWDHEGQSFLLALDKRTGKRIWKVLRPEVTSWATPIIVEHEGTPQVIVSGTGRVRGYDLATGKVIWSCGGLSANVVASPVAGDGMVFAASSYDIQAMLAIRLDRARGDVTGGPAVVWTRHRRTPYVPSPLLYGGSLYFLRHYQPILSRVDARTGEERHGPFRLRGLGNIYASPVAAAGRVYVTDRRGTTIVISHDESPRVLALNRLDDSISASAAICGRELYLRGEHTLYCIARASDGAGSGEGGAAR